MDATAFELELTVFLERLATVQDETLAVLQEKQRCLTEAHAARLGEVLRDEEVLVARLNGVLAERQEILDKAKRYGLAHESLEALASSLPKRSGVHHAIQNAIHRTRLIQYQSLTNWVLTQRSLLCVTQMLDLIAGRGKTPAVYSHDKKREFPDGNIVINRVA